MVNLIINAVEAMSPHAAGARDLVIRTVKTKSGSVLVAVCDSGPGVDPENLDRIFDAFFTTKGLPLTADMLEFRASSARGQELLSRASLSVLNFRLKLGLGRREGCSAFSARQPSRAWRPADESFDSVRR
jgi:hypothetical protein